MHWLVLTPLAFDVRVGWGVGEGDEHLVHRAGVRITAGSGGPSAVGELAVLVIIDTMAPMGGYSKSILEKSASTRMAP
jgi:hypothetical protein